ncbi:hypothetical protein pipiens_018750 [Culex pipiens pipiens]|uniref:Uncharacterized protein n=1 Tax=Culex pipiens pipiens TaxID=38569 RepID=A0ABD1DYJ5_CULPP
MQRRPRKPAPVPGPISTIEKRGRGRPKKVKVSKPRPEFPTFKIPQSKLDNARRFLATDPDPLVDRGCYGHITTRLNSTIPLRSVNNLGPTMDMARFCAVRGLWPELMQTVAIQCEHPRALAEPSFLRSFLLTNPACRNETDVDYCIERILEVYQGVALVPKWALRSKHSGGAKGTEETATEND